MEAGLFKGVFMKMVMIVGFMIVAFGMGFALGRPRLIEIKKAPNSTLVLKGELEGCKASTLYDRYLIVCGY
jgi:hypothetical protein